MEIKLMHNKKKSFDNRDSYDANPIISYCDSLFARTMMGDNWTLTLAFGASTNSKQLLILV